MPIGKQTERVRASSALATRPSSAEMATWLRKNSGSAGGTGLLPGAGKSSNLAPPSAVTQTRSSDRTAGIEWSRVEASSSVARSRSQ
jgi:hypothetical protein